MGYRKTCQTFLTPTDSCPDVKQSPCGTQILTSRKEITNPVCGRYPNNIIHIFDSSCCNMSMYDLIDQWWVYLSRMW